MTVTLKKVFVSFTLVHLSDLHYNAYPLHWSEWNFKRGLGAANLFLKRAKQHPLSRNRKLVEKVSNMDWDHLVISGDLTQLGLEQEFDCLLYTSDAADDL